MFKLSLIFAMWYRLRMTGFLSKQEIIQIIDSIQLVSVLANMKKSIYRMLLPSAYTWLLHSLWVDGKRYRVESKKIGLYWEVNER